MKHKFKPFVLLTKDMNPTEKLVARQNARNNEYGVHKCLFPSEPGYSIAGWYCHNNGNLETAKRLHREILDELRILPKLKL